MAEVHVLMYGAVLNSFLKIFTVSYIKNQFSLPSGGSSSRNPITWLCFWKSQQMTYLLQVRVNPLHP